MVNFTILQVVLLTLLAFIKHVDYYGIPMIFVNYAVFWGLITGVVMGDWKTGLVIGGTIQLMQLGVAGFGGSSIPDYGTMAIIATAYGVTLGSDTGLAIGLPVGMLGIQLDVVAKILNGFVVEKSQKFCNEGKFNQMNAILWVCPALFGLCAALPGFSKEQILDAMSRCGLPADIRGERLTLQDFSDLAAILNSAEK